MYERIVYTSRAAPGSDARTAYDIIRVAHNRNAEHGLSGALVLMDGVFLQVLEGPALGLRERFAAIARDPRHTDLQVREQVATTVRQFPGEWMALRHGSDIDPSTLQSFGYVPGFPPERFDPARLVAFVQACCSGQMA